MKYRKQAFDGIKYLIKENMAAFLAVVISAGAGIVIGIFIQNPDNEPDDLVYKNIIVRYSLIMLVAYAAVYFTRAYCFKGQQTVMAALVAVIFTFWGRAFFMLVKFGGVWGIINLTLLYVPLACFSAFCLGLVSVKLKLCVCFNGASGLKDALCVYGVNFLAIVLLNLVFGAFFDVIRF